MSHSIEVDYKAAMILLVDDIPDNIRVLGKILKEEGYSFAIATNGKETFDMLEQKIPDLILLDIMLPDSDGFEICKKLKENERTKDIPVIFLTAMTELEDKIRGFNAGAVDYITKPFEEAEVIARVSNHVRLKKSQDIIRQYYDDLEKEKQRLEVMAVTDELTRIYNRGYILERLSEEIERARRDKHNFSVIMADIDHFKQVNDTYGHQVGDRVLIGIVNAMKSTLRKTDLIGRYGGEEFLMILPETDLERAFHAAERIRKAVHQLRWHLQEMRVTVSAGVAAFKSEEKDFEFLKRADALLYQAKESGRNRVVF
jgi:diguanylate cyclase (GGDEF)-like protein